jgi:hypothetical protein
LLNKQAAGAGRQSLRVARPRAAREIKWLNVNVILKLKLHDRHAAKVVRLAEARADLHFDRKWDDEPGRAHVWQSAIREA